MAKPKSGWDLLNEQADLREAKKATPETPEPVEDIPVPASPVSESPPPQPPTPSVDRGRDPSLDKTETKVEQLKATPVPKPVARPAAKTVPAPLKPVTKKEELAPVEPKSPAEDSKFRPREKTKGYGEGTPRPREIDQRIPRALVMNPTFEVPQESPFYYTSLELLQGTDERGTPWLAGRGPTAEIRQKDAQKRAMYFNIAKRYVEGDLKQVPAAVRDEMLGPEYFGAIQGRIFKNNDWYIEQSKKAAGELKNYATLDPNIPTLLERVESTLKGRDEARANREPIGVDSDGDNVYSPLPAFPKEQLLKDHAKKMGYPNVDTYRRMLEMRGVNIDAVLQRMIPADEMIPLDPRFEDPTRAAHEERYSTEETKEGILAMQEERGVDLEDPALITRERIEEMADDPLQFKVAEESPVEREFGAFGAIGEARRNVTAPGEVGYLLAEELIRLHGTTEMMTKLNFGDPLEQGFGGYLDWQMNPDQKGSLAHSFYSRNGRSPNEAEYKELQDMAIKMIVASQTVGITNDPIYVSMDQLSTYNPSARRAQAYTKKDNPRQEMLAGNMSIKLAEDLARELKFQGEATPTTLAKRLASNYTEEELKAGLESLAEKEMTLWQALSGTRYEVLGMNNKGDILLRQEGNLGFVLDKMDTPEAAASGLIDEIATAWTQGDNVDIRRGLTTGLHERKNLTDLSIKYTQGMDLAPRAFFVGAATAASIANPYDALTLGGGAIGTGSRISRKLSHISGLDTQLGKAGRAVERIVGQDNIVKIARFMPSGDQIVIRKAYDEIKDTLNKGADFMEEGKIEEARAMFDAAMKLEEDLNKKFNPAMRALNAHDALTAGIKATSTKEGRGMVGKHLLANAPEDIRNELLGLHPAYRKGVLQDQMKGGLSAERARDITSMLDRLEGARDATSQESAKMDAVRRMLKKQRDAMEKKLRKRVGELNPDEQAMLDSMLSEQSIREAVADGDAWFEAYVERIRNLERIAKDSNDAVSGAKNARKELYDILAKNKKKNGVGRAERVWNAVQFDPDKVYAKAFIPSIRNRAQAAGDMSAQLALHGLKLYEKTPAEIYGELAKVKRLGIVSDAGKAFIKKLVENGIDGEDAGNAVHMMDAMAVSAVQRGQFKSIDEWYSRIDIASGKADDFAPTGEALMQEVAQELDIPKNLVAIHGVSLGSLQKALKAGGFPAPSISISRVERPLTDFGEIYFIGDKRLVDPRSGVPVYDTDAYTPRTPRTTSTTTFQSLPEGVQEWELPGLGKFYEEAVVNGEPSLAVSHINGNLLLRLKYGAQATAIDSAIANIAKQAAPDLQNTWHARSIIKELRYAFLSDSPSAVAEAKERVKAWLPLYKKAGPEGDVEYLSDEYRSLIDQTGWEPGDMTPERENKIIEMAHALGAPSTQEVLDQGARDVPATLDNLVAEMRKKTWRGGEMGDTFEDALYSAARWAEPHKPNPIRAMGAKKFESLEDIQSDRDRLAIVGTPGEFKANIAEAERLSAELASADARIGLFPIVANIYEARKADPDISDMDLIEKTYRGLAGMEVPTEQATVLAEEIVDYANDLVETVSTYFEAKPQRPVMFEEFSAVVVPEALRGTEEIEKLREMGLDVRYYRDNVSSSPKPLSPGIQELLSQGKSFMKETYHEALSEYKNTPLLAAPDISWQIEKAIIEVLDHLGVPIHFFATNSELAEGLESITEDDFVEALLDLAKSPPKSPNLAERARSKTDAIRQTAKEKDVLFQKGKRKVKAPETKTPDMPVDPTDAPDPTAAAKKGKKDKPELVEETFQKGAVEFLDDGEAVIHLFENADISTVLHEVGHIVRRDLPVEDNNAIILWAAAQAKKYGTKSDLSYDAMKAIGDVKYDPTTRLFVGNPESVRYVEEAFARGLEQYLRTGDVPNPAIRTIFGKVRDALRNIYTRVRDLGVSIDDSIKPVYDGLFDARRFGPEATKIEQPIGVRGARTQFMETHPGRAAERETNLVNTMWSFAESQPDDSFLSKTARSGARILLHAYIGGDALKNLANHGADYRRNILAGESWIHEGLGDLSRIFQEHPENPEMLARFLGGEDDLRFMGGRSLATNGYDYTNMVATHLRRLFEGYSPEERGILDRMAKMTADRDIIDEAGNVLETRRVYEVDETKFLTRTDKDITEAEVANNIIRSFFTKHLKDVDAVNDPSKKADLLHTPSIGTDLLGALGRPMSSDMQVDPELRNLFLTLYRSSGIHKGDAPIEGALGASELIEQLHSLKLAQGKTERARTVANYHAANRVIAVIAGHGLGIHVRETVWSNMGMYIPDSLANAYKQAVNGEIPADILMSGPVKELMRQLGTEARLMPDDLLSVGDNALYLPLGARKRLYRAMSRAQMEYDPVIGGLRGEDAGWFARSHLSSLNSMLLRFRVRGALNPRPQYNLMNAHDAGYQGFTETGLRRATAMEAAVNMQSILTAPTIGPVLMGIEAAVRAGGKALDIAPEERYLIQRLREGLANGGDWLAGKVNKMLRMAVLDDTLATNKVLRGLNEPVPGYDDLTYKQLKEIVVQERIKTGWSAAELSDRINRSVLTIHDGVFRKAAFVPTYALRSAVQVVDDFAEGFDEMMRVSCTLRLMETTGMQPRAAARVSNELVLFDFSANAAAFDRNPLIKFFWPFQMFNKSVRTSFVNNLNRPRHRRRMLKIARAHDRLPEAMTELMFDFSGVSPLGFDTTMMTEDERDMHEGIIQALEEEYGNAWKAPDDIKARLRYDLLRRSYRFESGAVFTAGDLGEDEGYSARFQALLEGGGDGAFDFSQSYRPRPGHKPGTHYLAEATGVPLIASASGNPKIQAYFAAMPEEVIYDYLHVPEPAIYSGFRHVYGLMALKYVMAAELSESGRRYISPDNPYIGNLSHDGPGIYSTTEMGSPAYARLSNAALNIIDPMKDPMYSNLLAQFELSDGMPVRVHPDIARNIEETMGVELLATSEVDTWDRAYQAIASLGATEGMRSTGVQLYRREALTYDGNVYLHEGTQVKDPAFWIPPGYWAFHFRNSPLYEVNQTMLSKDRAAEMWETEDPMLRLGAIFIHSGYRMGESYVPKGVVSKDAGRTGSRLDFLRKEGETPETDGK